MRTASLLAAITAVAIVCFSACSATDDDPNEASTGSPTGPGSGSGASGSGGEGNGTCGDCTGLDPTTWTPCVDGKPGTPQVCSTPSCHSELGCVLCFPDSLVCVGNEVHLCAANGQSQDEVVDVCDTAAGETCSDGACKDACLVAEDAPSNVGCEFWAVDLDQQDGFNDPASAPWGVVLSNTAETPAHVVIELNTAPVGMPPVLEEAIAPIDIPPGALAQLILPTRELDCGVMPNDYASPGTCLSSQAFRITSTSPIVAYQFNVFENAYSNDASLLLPTNALGQVYRALNWAAGHPALIPFGPLMIIDRSYITVVGTQPDTTVKVKPSWRIKGNPPIALTQPGGEIEVTIGPFDVLNLETDDATLQEVNQGIGVDLSGTVVQSDKPVAVFSGVETTQAPGLVDIPTFPGWTSEETCCLDHLEEQMFPLESVGLRYVATRSPVRSTGSYQEPDIIRFVGGAEAAQVTTTLPAPFDSFTIQPGEVKTTWTQSDVIVESDKPVIVGQILISNEYCEGNPIGDPSLTIFAPVEQFRSDYLILTPDSWSLNYVVFAVPDDATVTIDGVAANQCIVAPAGMLEGKTWEARRCPVSEGVHRIVGDQPFGIIAYGYGAAGSYAFVGGADVKKIYEPPVIK
jgi:hypothetical protein